MIDPTPIVTPTAILSGMTPDQQFYLALIGLLVAPIVSAITLFATNRTHKIVNSRMDEFKKIWTESAQVSLDEFKKALQDQALLAAQTPGARGEPGAKGATGERGSKGARGRR